MQDLCAHPTTPAPFVAYFRGRQALSVLDAGTTDPFGDKQARQESTPTTTPTPRLRWTGAAGDELKVLGELALSLAERFVPLMAAAALGRTVPPQPPPGGVAALRENEDAPFTASSASSSHIACDGGAADGGGGRANGAGGFAAGKAAGAAPPAGRGPQAISISTGGRSSAAARPTTLACFAAECALALTSVVALVASSSPSVAAAAAAAAAKCAGDGVSRGAGGGVKGEAPLVEADSTKREYEGSRNLPGDGSQHSREHLSGKPTADRPAREPFNEADKSVLRGDDGVREGQAEQEAQTGRRALGVLSVLFPVSTLPLLGLAEAWLGGGADETAAAAAAGRCCGADHGSYQDVDLTRIPASWGESGALDGGRIGDGFCSSLSNGGAALSGHGHEGGAGGRGLAVLAVRDLSAVVLSGMEMSRRSKEREEQRRRALERDGLEGETCIVEGVYPCE